MRRSLINRRGFMLGLGLVVMGSALAGAAKAMSARDVLDKFLSLDADAAGLTAETWPDLGRYTTWPSAPGWDSFVIIERYDIGRVLEGHTRAQGTVTYYPIGTMANGFTANRKPETVVYHLNKVQDEWKVDSPQLVPHVRYDVMRQRLEARSAKDPKAKAANDQLIQQIDAARQRAR